MWEEILKASWASKNFGKLKSAILEQVKDLEVGKTYQIEELYNNYEKYVLFDSPSQDGLNRQKGYFVTWFRHKGKNWYFAKFGAIALNSGMMVKSIESSPDKGMNQNSSRSRSVTVFTRIDPNAEQE